MSFVRSISGIRATLGDDMTPEMVAKYVVAFAKATKSKKSQSAETADPQGYGLKNLFLQPCLHMV
jgi:hypothetical protein